MTQGPTGLLQRVIASQRIHSVYQPIIRFSDRSVAAMEALARFETNADSVGNLFQEATARGQLSDLDWMCRKVAIRNARSLPPHILLNLNVSVAAVADFEADCERMTALAGTCGRNPSDIVLEITDASENSAERLVEAVVTYRSAGFQLALDAVSIDEPDVLDDLIAIAPDVIKFNRLLAERLDELDVRLGIAQIVEAAWDNRWVLVAQGIEDPEQMRSFAKLGVGIGQGFLLGRPSALSV